MMEPSDVGGLPGWRDLLNAVHGSVDVAHPVTCAAAALAALHRSSVTVAGEQRRLVGEIDAWIAGNVCWPSTRPSRSLGGLVDRIVVADAHARTALATGDPRSETTHRQWARLAELLSEWVWLTCDSVVSYWGIPLCPNSSRTTSVLVPHRGDQPRG
ncbi:hypothetical protein [Nocardia sp. alder85J]|uniref:hypothetical protein n=1 Tax=Nocardia sp. alder85J TaxID=2862949 RepID=UPI001CD29105|nr:hypothetical protein [Nocardia sp. alder85J]MCX4094578.1 hypothetical protein [Nocardia sp. alder85J]